MNKGILAKLMATGEKLSVKSALNPILWLAFVVHTPCIIFYMFTNKPFPLWLIILVYLPIITAVFGFIFLIFVDRDKLQSEEYQLQNKSLDLMQVKGNTPVLSNSKFVKNVKTSKQLKNGNPNPNNNRTTRTK